ncbi:endonuclease/exonuclease/phosphatase family protein [Singulisphaera rosea]
MDEPEVGDRNPGRQTHRAGFRLLALVSCVWAAWLMGQVVRDRSWLFGLLFDFPSSIMAGLCVAATVRLRSKGEKRLAVALGLLALAPIGMVGLVENQWRRPRITSPAGEAFTLSHWNLGYGIWGLRGVEDVLLDRRSHLYVLSEAPVGFETRLAKRLGPGYTAVRMGTMAVVAEGRVSPPRRLTEGRTIQVDMMSWESRGERLEIFAVDIGSSLRVARDPLLRQLQILMETHRPDVVVGDFNSPRRSRALCPPPEGFVHAYDVAGSGWSATWPVPCPVLAIDQCLVSSRISPIRYDLDSTWHSDHRLQQLEFVVAHNQDGDGVDHRTRPEARAR